MRGADHERGRGLVQCDECFPRLEVSVPTDFLRSLKSAIRDSENLGNASLTGTPPYTERGIEHQGGLPVGPEPAQIVDLVQFLGVVNAFLVFSITSVLQGPQIAKVNLLDG